MSQDTTTVMTSKLKTVKAQYTVETNGVTLAYQLQSYPKICICEHKMLIETTCFIF